MVIEKFSSRALQFPAARSTTEPLAVRIVLIGLTLILLTLFLFLPLACVFYQALSDGVVHYLHAVSQEDTLWSIYLTLLTAAIAVPLNIVFGIAAAWAIAKFDFRGKSLLLALIDLPFSVSPVVAGLTFVLLFGPRRGWLGPWLHGHGIRIIYAVPGIVLATLFITFPFVARELIPLMESQGTDEEQAARVLGAGPWQTFFRVTLPNIKWGLLYGVILCNARAMGEFGAVYVVSGAIRGLTCTMPLQIEQLYSDDYVGAFAVASLLCLLAVATLVLKAIIERRTAAERGAGVTTQPAPARGAHP